MFKTSAINIVFNYTNNTLVFDEKNIYQYRRKRMGVPNNQLSYPTDQKLIGKRG